MELDSKISIPSFIDPKITLEESTHTYLLDGIDPGFTSVTTLLHEAFNPFEPEKIAKKLLQYPKYAGRTVEDILAEWKQTSVDGTNNHLEMENYILKQALPTNQKTRNGVAWLSGIIDRDHYVLYPEVILYNKELKLAGMVDLILQEKATGHLHVFDWKFTRAIRWKSFDKDYGIVKATSHLQNCNGNVYTLQLSVYRYLLEKFYGATVHSTHIVHLTEECCKLYKCGYFKDVVEALLTKRTVSLHQ